jgi:hypothetical protein
VMIPGGMLAIFALVKLPLTRRQDEKIT